MEKYIAVACGIDVTFAIKEDGTLEAWGDDSKHQQDDLEELQEEGETFTAIASGFYHSVGIRTNGKMALWGDYRRNQVRDFPSGIAPKAIACGKTHSVAINEDGTVVQWGGSTNKQRDNAPSADMKFKAIACGGDFSVGIKEDGAVYQWGSTDNNVTDGLDSTLKFKLISCGAAHCVGIKEDGTVYQWGNSVYNQKKNFPSADMKFKEVACGGYFTVGIKEDGTVYQWGSTKLDVMNDSPSENEEVKIKLVACGRRHTSAINEDGEIVEWGFNTNRFIEQQEEVVAGALETLESETPETLEPNPYPKYNPKIAIESLPKKPFAYTDETKAFDAVMQDDVSIDEALADADKPILVKVGDSLSLLSREYMKKGIEDYSLIRYGCNIGGGLMVFAKNVYGRNPFVYIKGLSLGNFLVLLAEMNYVLNTEGINAIELVPTEDTLATISSFGSVIRSSTGRSYSGNEVNIVGADHCQAGTQQKVYTINILELSKTGGKKKRKTRRRKGALKTKRRS